MRTVCLTVSEDSSTSETGQTKPWRSRCLLRKRHTGRALRKGPASRRKVTPARGCGLREKHHDPGSRPAKRYWRVFWSFLPPPCVREVRAAGNEVRPFSMIAFQSSQRACHCLIFVALTIPIAGNEEATELKQQGICNGKATTPNPHFGE